MTFSLLAVVAIVNVAAFLAFGFDKRCAVNGERRVREDTLLTLALFGGALGALLGQQWFHHKTRKQPFRTYLWGAAFANLGVAGLLLNPDLRVQIMALFGG